jgi:signal transduction histidine kinase/CheY-like chemotaxis protein
MSQAPTHDAAGSGYVRFQLAIQQTRAAVYALGGLIAVVFRRAGILQVSLPAIVTVTGVALASVVFFAVVYRRGLGRGWPVRPEPLWLACDVALTTAGVYITGGIASEWFIWYIAIAGAAAFVVGRSGAFRVGVACTASYVLVLAAMGQIQGVDRNLFLALGRMTFLYAASAFFLRGTADLQQRRLVISRLQENESRKVAELTRLTAALDQRTRELAEANVKIREADRLKSQFLANMSHELRTPLNSIIGFSEILSSRLAGQVPEKQLRFLHNINVSGQHLLAIINDILDLSKIEAGRMELHPERFPLYGIISGVCTIMKGVTGTRDISLVTDIPEDLPPIEADPVKTKQILYNLIANAVKFSPEHSAVTIRVRRLAAGDSPLGQEALQIEVIDQGIGIDPKDRDLIFREFQQADGTSTRQYEGTGLGLALVKKFVDLHGGSVDVHSQVGHGSNFVVLLPVRFQGHGRRAPSPPAPPPADSRHRIVVVEDDPTAYETLSRDLAAAGYLPVRARHGEEALSLVRKTHPSAVTLDLVLPGLDGWEILKALKQDAETQDIPVIIVSMIDNRELGFALGATDYFLKPVNTAHLVERLGEIVPSAPAHPRLLLIDDDEAVHAMLEDLLSPLGYRLDHASSGAEGIEKATRETPSLVLLDLMMQGMDGFEVAARLKSQPRTERLPILVLTAKDLSPEERRRLSGKINALVQKGDGSPSRLVAAIRDLVPPPPAEAQRA